MHFKSLDVICSMFLKFKERRSVGKSQSYIDMWTTEKIDVSQANNFTMAKKRASI